MDRSVYIIAILVLLSIYITGCSCEGCTGCGCSGCCGGEDLSEDEDDDGDLGSESVPTNLGQPTYTNGQRVESVCGESTKNSVNATASKSGSDLGYVYSYTYSIRACGSTLGYNVVLDGSVPKVIEQGYVSADRENTKSSTYQSTDSYTRFCVKTGDTSIGDGGNYCVNFG